MISLRSAIVFCLCIQTIAACSYEVMSPDYKTDCRREALSDIPEDVFDITTHLIFSSNQLRNLTYNRMLSRFFNLKVLNVSHNYLTQDSFRPDVFSEIKTLTKLDLQRNRITGVSSPFIRNAQIKLLKLDYNKITHISADFLVTLPMLEELTLSHCQIQTVSGQAFRSIGTNLRKLDLSNNELETLSKDLRTDVFSTQLLSIRLYNNYWVCDCHLKWLREAVGSTSASWYFFGHSIVPECEEPKSLKHKNWFLATPELYGCAPLPVDQWNDSVASLGEDLTLRCSVLTYTKPSSVEWLQNDVTIDYKPRLTVTRAYNGSLLTTTLTIKGFTERDYGLYKCNVNTTFGRLTQEGQVSAPPSTSALSVSNTGVVVAIVVVCIAVIIAVALVVTFYLKKNLVHRGKLYMDAVSESQKSEADLSHRASRCDDVDVSAMTPLNALEGQGLQPDVIKCYGDEDELDSLPADTEYPLDDAGCAEYNQYLETVSSANNSPAFIEPANNGPTYIRTVSPNQGPVYINPASGYLLENSQMSLPAPLELSHYSTNHNGSLVSRANPIVPYMETPTSTSDSPDSLSDQVISRLNTTPSGSPLTFIKEESDEEGTTAAGDLL